MRTKQKRVLRDAALDRALAREGYTVVDLVAPGAAAALRDRFGEVHGWERQELFDHQPPDFEIALWDPDLTYRRRVAEMVDEVASVAIERLFVDQRPVGRSFMVKWPAEPGSATWDGVPDCFHNDWSYVDERDGSRSYGVWLALQDVDVRNGCVHVVPHSHRLPRTLRGWDIDSPWLTYDEVFRRRAVPVELRAGQAYVWDPALVHRSGPNRTAEARVAVSILTTEPGAPLSIFRRRDEGTAEKVMIGDDFFLAGRFDDVTTLPASETAPIEEVAMSERAVSSRLAVLAAQGRISQAAHDLVRGRA